MRSDRSVPYQGIDNLAINPLDLAHEIPAQTGNPDHRGGDAVVLDAVFPLT